MPEDQSLPCSREERPIVGVVDPDEAVRMSLQSLLATLDCCVKTAASAEDFLADFDPDRSRCLVMEIHLPGMSGLELLERLREKGAVLPVIILASHGDIPMAVEAMRGGAIDFIEKPFVERVLLQRIKQALQTNSSAPSE